MSTLDTDPNTPASASELVPARQPRLVSRRSVLGGLGVGSLAALVAPMFGLAPTAAADPIRPQDDPTPLPANYTPAGPFSLGASCELTEDFFATDEVLIDLAGGDEILPFTTQAGDVEAIVVTGSGTSRQIAHLARDTSTLSGWSYTSPIPTGLQSVVSAAVGGLAGQQSVLMVLGTVDNIPFTTMLQLCSNGWAAVGKPVVAFDVQVVKSGNGPAGPFFYAWGAVQQPRLTLTVQLFDSANTKWTTVVAGYYSRTLDVDNVELRWDPQGKDGWVVVSANGSVITAAQNSPTTYVNLGANGVTIKTPKLDTMLGAYGTGPQIVWQDSTGEVNITYTEAGTSTTTQVSLASTTGSAQSSVAAWQWNNEYRLAFCLDETIAMVTQLPPTPSQPRPFTPAIPMLPGITKVFGVDSPDLAVLFAVDLDSSLSVLSLGPTGWTQNLIRQASVKVQEITTWACHLPVIDANNLPVPNASVQVSTDRPVVVWQEGETNGSSTTLVPGTPVTFTCDPTGTLVLALPTNELDAAQLTVQALDSTGKPSGSPLTVRPDTDVQAFLNGTAALTSVGSKLTGDAMVGAQSSTWDTASQTYTSPTPLFPVITGLSGSRQSDAASACAAAIAHVANLPTAVPAAASDIRSGCLDLTGSAPTFATSSDPDHFTSSASGDTSWWDKAKNDVKSVFHGLRHGAIHLTKLVSSWSNDARNWTLNLVVTLEDDVEHVINFIVQAAEDAIHAISSFFHALGADIEKAWNWLKHFVLGVIKDADVTAKQLQAWFSDLVTAGVNILDNLEQRTDTFFHDQETAVTAQIATWQSDITGTSVGSGATTPTPTTDSSGDNSNLAFKAVEDFFKVMQDGPANWLWKKIKKHLPSLPSTNLNMSLSTFQDTITDLGTDLTDAVTTVDDLGTLMLAAFKTFSTPAAFEQADMGDLLGDLGTFADDVLVLLDKVVDTVLDLMKDLLNALEDLLNSEFLPSVIVDILKLAGVDSTLSIARVMTLIAAYPITIVHNLWVGEGPLFDFSTDTTHHTGVGRGAADKNGFGLDLAAGVVQFIWSGVDVVIDLDSVGAKSMGPQDGLFNIADWVLPIIMTILQWPTPWNATSTPVPCKNWDFDDATQWGQHNNFVKGIILSTIAPWMCQGIAYCWQTKSPNSSGAELLSTLVTPVVQSAMAAGNNVLGAWWQYANQNASKTDKANAVLDWTIPNLSYVDCPLAIEEVVDASQGVSLGVKLVIDCVANYGATAICFQQAVAAHG